MRRIVLCLTLMVLVAACENSTDPFGGIITGGGGAVTPAQATGNWSFTVQRTTGLPCTSALASGQVITAHLDVLSTGVLSAASFWANPVTGASQQPLSGAVTLSNGLTDITFSTPSASGTAAMELTGTLSAGGALTGGVLTDPAPGFFQVFGTDGCRYSVTGVKTG